MAEVTLFQINRKHQEEAEKERAIQNAREAAIRKALAEIDQQYNPVAVDTSVIPVLDAVETPKPKHKGK